MKSKPKLLQYFFQKSQHLKSLLDHLRLEDGWPAPLPVCFRSCHLNIFHFSKYQCITMPPGDSNSKSEILGSKSEILGKALSGCLKLQANSKRGAVFLIVKLDHISDNHSHCHCHLAVDKRMFVKSPRREAHVNTLLDFSKWKSSGISAPNIRCEPKRGVGLNSVEKMPNSFLVQNEQALSSFSL